MEINKDILGMTLQESEDYLEHHGILGQKWGVRRTPAQLGHKVASGGKKAAKATGKAVEKGAKKVAAKIDNDRKVSKAKKAAKKKAEEDAAEAQRKHDAEVKESRSFKSVTKLTDAELNARINRLKREAEYQNLLQQTGLIEAGKKQVQASFLKGVGSVVESTTKSKGKEIVDSLLNTDISVQNVKKGKQPKSATKKK